MKVPLALLSLALLAGCAQPDPIVGIWLSNDKGFKAGYKTLKSGGEYQSMFREFRKNGTWVTVIHENTAAAEFYVIFEGTWSRKNGQLVTAEESGITVPVFGNPSYKLEPAEPSPQDIKALTSTTLELEANGKTQSYTRTTKPPADMNSTIWSSNMLPKVD